ncbi:Retrovirus-related Pol polyprotein from transposon 297 [Labeo rohita]|uniref:Retrovirus-related Pol polyprotein from transposon 297 n=1 Tax=Labeo rohita TaxID=84645 RepID=A0A498NVA7_LABRO|nr:Retrovirus-related Pol polyprotein from transposon 297 [Labeo rohita]
MPPCCPHEEHPLEAASLHIPARNKLTATYNHKPYKVTTVKGSMVTAERDGHRVTRNPSFFKKLDPGLCDTSTAEEDEEVTADTVPVLAKYPARHRRPPQYLRDFVMD